MQHQQHYPPNSAPHSVISPWAVHQLTTANATFSIIINQLVLTTPSASAKFVAGHLLTKHRRRCRASWVGSCTGATATIPTASIGWVRYVIIVVRIIGNGSMARMSLSRFGICRVRTKIVPDLMERKVGCGQTPIASKTLISSAHTGRYHAVSFWHHKRWAHMAF